MTDRRRGIRTAGTAVAKLLVLYVFVLALCLYAAHRVGDASSVVARGSDIVSASFAYLVPFVPIPVLAFLYGSMDPGGVPRLVMRLVSALYLAVVILVLTGDLSYTVHGAVLDEAAGTFAEDLGMTIGLDGFGAILLAVPVLSAADAVLERMQHRDAGV